LGTLAYHYAASRDPRKVSRTKAATEYASRVLGKPVTPVDLVAAVKHEHIDLSSISDSDLAELSKILNSATISGVTLEPNNDCVTVELLEGEKG